MSFINENEVIQFDFLMPRDRIPKPYGIGKGMTIKIVDILVKEHYMLDRMLVEYLGYAEHPLKPKTIKDLLEAPWYTKATVDEAFEFFMKKRCVIDQVLVSRFKNEAPAMRVELNDRVRACSDPLQVGVKILKEEKPLPRSFQRYLFQH